MSAVSDAGEESSAQQRLHRVEGLGREGPRELVLSGASWKSESEESNRAELGRSAIRELAGPIG